MKLTEEQMKQYYAARGIDHSDLLSTDEILLSELPRDVQLGEPNRSIVAQIIKGWNQLDPLSKIDAALSTEERVLKPRRRPSILDMHITAEAWCAYLMLGRLRDSEARREIMQKIARGELTPVAPRRGRRERKLVEPLTPGQRREAAAFLAPIHARLHAQGFTGVRRETTRERASDGETITIHHIRPTRN